jgi:hypothetical protein
MKKAKLSDHAPKVSLDGTTYLWHAHAIGIKTRHVAFEKHEKMLGKERGIQYGTIFKDPRSFDFFIKGAREVNINFTKIKNLTLYRTLKKSDLESQSRSQLVKIILQEVMEIVIEDHGVDRI